MKAKVSEKERQQIAAEWRRRLADAGQAVENGRPAYPNTDNRQIGEFFECVVGQLQGFVSTNLLPCWYPPLTLFSHPESATSSRLMQYPSSTPHPSSRGQSRFVTSDEGLRRMFESQLYGARDLIEWIIDLSV